MIVPTTSQTALLTLETARTLLARDHDAILAMVDSGALRWAFDLSVSGQPPRAVRVWGYSISCFQRGVADEDNVETVLAAILLGRRARLRASELTHRLSCSHDHLTRLVDGRRIVGGVEDHTLWLNCDSVARFLGNRVIGGNAIKSFIGARGPHPAEPAASARRGQEPVCMFLQGACPPAPESLNLAQSGNHQMADPEVRIKIKADASDAKKGFGDFAKEIPGVGRALDLIKNPVALLAAGFTAVAAGTRAMVASFSEAQEAAAGLDATLANSGQLTDAYREKLLALSGQLQDTTGIADDKWVAVLEKLTQYGARPENIGISVDAVKNLAGILKGDLAGASDLVARAMEGNFTGFRRLLPQFEATGNAAQDLQELFRQLAEKGAGLLEARQKTLAGQSRTLANSWDDLKEAGGELINRTGILQAGMYGLSTSMNWLVGTFGSAVPALDGLRNKMGEAKVDTDLLKQSVDQLKQKLNENKTALEEEMKVLDRRRAKLNEQARAQDEIRNAALAAEKSSIDRDVSLGKSSPEDGMILKQRIEQNYATTAEQAKEAQLAQQENLARTQLDALTAERTQLQQQIVELKRGVQGDEKAKALRAEAETARQSMEQARGDMLKSQQFMSETAGRAPLAAVDDTIFRDAELNSTRFSGRAGRFLAADKQANAAERQGAFARQQLAEGEARFAEFDPQFKERGYALINEIQGIQGQRTTGRKVAGFQRQTAANQDIVELMGARNNLEGQREQLSAGFISQIQGSGIGGGHSPEVAAMDKLAKTILADRKGLADRILRVEQELRYQKGVVGDMRNQ